MAGAWRIVKARRAGTAFSGEGAAMSGGRWNSRGVKVIYASETRSLAVLENLVHINPAVQFEYSCFHLEFDDSLVEKILPSGLPKNWNSYPPGPSTQKIGDGWVHAGRSAVLAVPSAIVDGEFNYLLNPAHPDFKKIKIGKPEPFTFDPRLL
jgi:RES domain-containing protein